MHEQEIGSADQAPNPPEPVPNPSEPAPNPSEQAAVTLAPPPRLGTIYLDCSPLDAGDVRDSSRTQADLITGLREALDSDGGVAFRMATELLAQQRQWSTGRLPFVTIRPDDLQYKFDQVWRDKIGAPGISTQLVKDQYGVIRRMDIDQVVQTLGPGTRIVYFLPENRLDDHTVAVETVEARLLRAQAEHALNLTIVTIPGGHHASAESNSDVYLRALTTLANRGD